MILTDYGNPGLGLTLKCFIPTGKSGLFKTVVCHDFTVYIHLKLLKINLPHRKIVPCRYVLTDVERLTQTLLETLVF